MPARRSTYTCVGLIVSLLILLFPMVAGCGGDSPVGDDGNHIPPPLPPPPPTFPGSVIASVRVAF